MKQTNNAIKFLMAQYRAIFQNAYFKGLATAAVVTMGLAAGQAQATAINQSAFDAIATDTDITSANPLNVAAKANNANEITLTIKSGADHKFTAGASTASNATLIIKGEGAAADTKLTIKGAADADTSLDVKNFELKTGTLALDDNATTNSGA